jgi:integrase
MLTDTEIRQAKAAVAPFKLVDGAGLYLLVNPNGSRWWRFRYRFEGREKQISLGTYPDTSLKLAREKRDNARAELAAGINPSAKRQATKLARADTFGAIAREWLEQQRKKLAATTFAKAKWVLEDLLFPRLEKRPITSITPQELLGVLRLTEARGKHETAHRARQRAGQVFRYAVATGRADRDIAADLRGALAPVVTENRAAITDPRRIGQLLRAIDGYQGQPTVMAALKLAPLLFVRPGELRGAEWTELDLEGAEWRIGAERNKMREEHIVPLPTQAVAIFERLHAITGRGRLAFPSLTSRERPISENSVTAALRRMGYAGDEMTWHGFRALASTRLNEIGFAPDVIERQLQHQERNKVRAAYNRSQLLDERRKMMQAWADYLDGLRQDSGSVIATLRTSRA